MHLKDLVDLYPEIKNHPKRDLLIKDFSRSDKNPSSKSVFVAIQGSKWDGHEAVKDLLKSDCPLLVVEKNLGIESDKILQVKNTKEFYAHLAHYFYHKPSEKLFSVALTGTNGKTTTAYYIFHLLKQVNRQVGLITTIEHRFDKKTWSTDLTSPGAKELQSRLKEFVDLGADSFVMEASSHAIEQYRIGAVEWDVAIFTNLSQDHLDYHGDMKSYFLAKQKLFNYFLPLSNKKKKLAIVNKDDSWSEKIIKDSKLDSLSFGKSASDLQFQIQTMDFSTSKVLFFYKGIKKEYLLPLIGEHNIYNLSASLLALVPLGYKPFDLLDTLCEELKVSGRLEKIDNTKGIHTFIDFAHSEDSLYRVLLFLKEIRKQAKSEGKILCLFGCGGNRDKTKRPKMARVASENADFVILTSDNPRDEEPISIINEAKKGLVNNNYICIENRKEAILYALQKAKANDIVLIAGKGHEKYQEIAGKKEYFSDQKIVEDFFND